MTPFRASSFAAAALLLAACSRTPKPDIPAEESAIRALSAHSLELENAHDAMGTAALFADDGIRYRSHSEAASGVVAIEAAATREFADNPKLIADWTTDTVVVAASGDVAFEVGTYTLAHAGPKGDADDRGHFMTVYRKVNGQWKIVREMGATAKPQLQPMAPKATAPRVTLASARSKASSKTAAVRKGRAGAKVAASKTSAKHPVKPGARSVAKASTRSAKPATR